jgi:hypothetical protein
MTDVPTSRDVIEFLNARLTELGAAERVTYLNVLPYVNPMWLANWEAPELAGVGELDEEICDARWQFPQILEEPSP